MMKLLLTIVVVTALVAVASGQGLEKICCTVDQWQGRVHGTAWANSSGTLYQERFAEYVYYSYPTAVRADFLVDLNDNTANGTLIYRYDQGQAFYIQPNGGCWWAPLPAEYAQMPQACATTRYLQRQTQFTIGAVLLCTRFTYRDPRDGVDADVVLAHPDQRSCVAVEGQLFDHQADVFGNTRFEYFDVLQQVLDPMIFAHPATSFCTQTSFNSLSQAALKDRVALN